MHNNTTDGSAQRQVEYRSLDFLGIPGYRVGSDGSVWSELRKKGLGGKRGVVMYRSGRWHKLSPIDGGLGYLRVGLRKPGERRKRLYYVHALVLLAFVGPCPEGQETRHLDGSRDNNVLSNLAYGTHLENEADKERHGRRPRGEKHFSRTNPEKLARGERNGSHTHPERRARGQRNGAYTHPEKRPHGEGIGNSKLTEADVREIRRLYAEGGWTCATLGERFGVTPCTINNLVRRRTWRHVP